VAMLSEFHQKQIEFTLILGLIARCYHRKIIAERGSQNHQLFVFIYHQTVRIFIYRSAEIAGPDQILTTAIVLADCHITIKTSVDGSQRTVSTLKNRLKSSRRGGVT